MAAIIDLFTLSKAFAWGEYIAVVTWETPKRLSRAANSREVNWAPRCQTQVYLIRHAEQVEYVVFEIFADTDRGSLSEG